MLLIPTCVDFMRVLFIIFPTSQFGLLLVTYYMLEIFGYLLTTVDKDYVCCVLGSRTIHNCFADSLCDRSERGGNDAKMFLFQLYISSDAALVHFCLSSVVCYCANVATFVYSVSYDMLRHIWHSVLMLCSVRLCLVFVYHI